MAPTSSTVAQTEPALRRTPSQRRARERVARILDCAESLIAHGGSDALRMSEVAEMAEISVGSLYQYFPDKSAIIKTLMERYHRQSQECIRQGLEGVTTGGELCAAFSELIDTYYAMFRADPAMCDIWAGAQADKSLQAVELSESRAQAVILAEIVAGLRPEADPREIEASTFTIMHLGEATMRLAVALEPAEADAAVAAYKRMALAELASMTKD